VAEDQDLGERDHSEPDPFPPPDRRIVTQAYDLSLGTLVEQWQNGQLLLPDFQREYVWSDAKASRLIESLLLNIPVPVVYFAETENATFLVIDGHQRIWSIVRYFENQYRLSGLRISDEFKGKRFFELPEKEQRFLQMRVLRAIILTVESHPDMKFEVFERLNTGGVALNAQEVRNAIFRGPLNELLIELERLPEFLGCLSRAEPRKRMVDRELVLRFLALRSDYSNYRPSLLRFLNDFMREHQTPTAQWLSAQRRLFTSTTTLVKSVYGGAAFRIIDADGRPTERNINRALFDAQMLVLSTVEAQTVSGRERRDLLASTARLMTAPEFDDAIRTSTGDRMRLRSRVEQFAAMVSDAGLKPRMAQLAK